MLGEVDGWEEGLEEWAAIMLTRGARISDSVHPEGYPDNGREVSDLDLSWGSLSPLDAIRCP